MTTSITNSENTKRFRGWAERTWTMRGNATGFTLVELIIVMVIIIILALLSLPTLRYVRDFAKQTRAMEEIRDIEKSINAYALEKNAYPNTLSDLGLPGGVPLDPWGHPYVYLVTPDGVGARTDVATNPTNTDFDLYSIGPDGASALDLTDPTSADDVIRGQNGSFVGIASKY